MVNKEFDHLEISIPHTSKNDSRLHVNIPADELARESHWTSYTQQQPGCNRNRICGTPRLLRLKEVIYESLSIRQGLFNKLTRSTKMSKENTDGYYKVIVDKAAENSADKTRAIIDSVGGYMKSQLKTSLSRTALIQIISNTDTPEWELEKVCKLLGISSLGTAVYTWDTMPNLS